MPNSCMGMYRRVAVVQLNQHYTAHGLRPKMISERAVGVLRVVDLGKHNVGKTDRCAYRRKLKEAQEMVDRINSDRVTASGELLITGASA